MRQEYDVDVIETLESTFGVHMRQLLPDGQRQGPAQEAGAENGDGGEKKLLSGIFSHGFTGEYISAPEPVSYTHQMCIRDRQFPRNG